jgi:hypothetical protein
MVPDKVSDRSSVDPTLASNVHRQQRILINMYRGMLLWFLIYIIFSGNDGFFGRTVDRVNAMWVQMLFLNIPLQILLVGACAAAATSSNTFALRIGIAAGALNAVLILCHIVLSVITA